MQADELRRVRLIRQPHTFQMCGDVSRDDGGEGCEAKTEEQPGDRAASGTDAPEKAADQRDSRQHQLIAVEPHKNAAGGLAGNRVVAGEGDEERMNAKKQHDQPA